MGFDVHRFVGPVDPDLICKLCEKVLENPLSFPCGHVNCARCALHWLSIASSCPARCQTTSTRELNHVLPLKNLVLKLEVKCDNHERGCALVMMLRDLSEHVQVCDFSPIVCGNDCKAELNRKDVLSHRCHRATEVPEEGCRLLSLKESSKEPDCLKTSDGLLQTKALSLEKELKRQAQGFWRRERALLATISALHCEQRITARAFQRKRTEYKTRVDALTDGWTNRHQEVIEGKLPVSHDQVADDHTTNTPSEVEVRPNTTKTTSLHQPVQRIDNSTQTHITLQYLNHIETLAQIPLPSGSLSMPRSQVARCDDPCLTEVDGGVQKATKCKVLEFQVDLQRQTIQGKTDQMSSKLDDEKMNVFVGKVHPERSAAKDGQIPRDQIKSTDKEEEGTTDTARLLSNHQEKASELPRTDESTWNGANPEHDILSEDLHCLCDTLPENHKKFINSECSFENMTLSNNWFSDFNDCGNFLNIPTMPSEHFQKMHQWKYLMNSHNVQEQSSNVDHYYQEVQMLNEELLRIELECLSIIQAHRFQMEKGDQEPKKTSTKPLPKKVKYKRHQDHIRNKIDNEGSTSAYNTGESCWSLHPALESDSPVSEMFQTGDKGKGSPMNRCNSTTARAKHSLCPIQEISPTKGSPGDSGIQNLRKRLKSKKMKSKTLSTSYKNIYIPAHAQHYQSYMQLIQQKSAVEYSQSQANLARNTESDSKPKNGWKVMVRSDGTRYVTKSPVRSKLLKERALRIQGERCSATTDDDAGSELKLGRYWNKKERKKQAVQAQQLRHQRELVKQSQQEIKETLDDKDPDIIQLSRKRMLKRRNKKIFDNWMTIQELLTHGTKCTDGTRQYNCFLSVTTV